MIRRALLAWKFHRDPSLRYPWRLAWSRAGRFRMSRRVIPGARRYTVAVKLDQAAIDDWAIKFEERALLDGYLAVIDGKVIYPKTLEARDAIDRITSRDNKVEK